MIISNEYPAPKVEREHPGTLARLGKITTAFRGSDGTEQLHMGGKRIDLINPDKVIADIVGHFANKDRGKLARFFPRI